MKQNGKKDTKRTALNAQQLLFPGVDLRKSSRARKQHDGLVDALLIAYRTYLQKRERSVEEIIS
jgi:hypothetical protein